MPWLLLACVQLEAGDYTIDHARVAEDDCDLFRGGQAHVDETVTVSWLGEDLRFSTEAESLTYSVSGRAFRRDSEGVAVLDDDCAFATTMHEEGWMEDATSFSGETTVEAVLTGGCATWTAVFGDACSYAWTWEGLSE